MKTTLSEHEALQNFANKFGLKVKVFFPIDKRKVNTYYLFHEQMGIVSPSLDYENLNHFLLGWNNSIKSIRLAINNFYLDYVNNYLTIDKFADAYNLNNEDAKNLLLIGKNINNEG